MPIYLFLDEEPDVMEASGPAFSLVKPLDTHPWMQELGFMYCGLIDEGMTYFADSSRVTPYPDLLSRRQWLENLLAHYRHLAELKRSPDYPERIAKLKAELAQVEEKKEELLKPAREFSKTNLKTGSFADPDWRAKEKRARAELGRIYTKLKSTPEYQALIARQDELIAQGRDLLEADGYPKDEAEAQRMMEGSGIVVVHDRVLPPTLDQKSASIEAALDSLNTLAGQKRFLTELLRVAIEKHERVGLGVANSLSPMPTGVVDQNEFLANLPIPIPKHRIFIIENQGKTA